MEWLTQYINIWYMLTFMSVAWYVLKEVSMPRIITPAWAVLIVGVVIGLIWCFLIQPDATPKIMITTFATGTSFYELLIKAILKKYNVHHKK